MKTQRTLTIRQWLRSRPLEVDVVDGRLSQVAPVRDDERWNMRPLYRLIDRLTEDHADFRSKDLPRIDHLLGIMKMEMGLASAPAEEALADFQAFRQELVWHMDEEETYLFPKILRTEACLYHPELYPETYKSTASVTPLSQPHISEEELLDMLSVLTQKMYLSPLLKSYLPRFKEIFAELAAFSGKLNDHADLDSEILHQRMMEMDRELVKRAALA